MIVTTGLAVVVALQVTRTDPQYSASAEVVVAPTITSSGNYIQPSMPTEQRVATSTGVISSAADRLGMTSEETIGHLSVAVPVDTQVLVLTYTADTPGAALSGANALAQAYLQARNPKNGKNAVASLVSAPELPSAPLGTNYALVMGAAVLGGLLTGYAFALAWDRVRGRIRTIADAEQCADLDALAVTPLLPWRSISGDPRKWAGRSQLDAVAARVLAEVEREKRSTVLVTGAGSECGSTAVAVLTALALARMGRVVILVTADEQVVARMSRARDPRRETTVTSRDLGSDARASRQEGLHLIPVAEWDGGGLAAASLANLLPELQHRLPEALIVIDGPPAWFSAGIALRVDKIMLVVALGRCSRKSAAIAVQALDHCAEKMMGLVITPRRGHARHELRAWASRRLSRIMFRIAPPRAGSASASAAQARPDTIASPPVRTGRNGLKATRSSVAESDRTGDAKRLSKPQPNGEPTSSVLS
jgi:Mrp family chromosome partitioning ATPase/capsular polysaccharide biosynthesis protein